MALRKASRLLLVILTAWSLCGIGALLDVEPLSNPTQLLVSSAHAGDPDDFSDGTDKPGDSDADTSESHEGLIPAILEWIEDVIQDLLS